MKIDIDQIDWAEFERVLVTEIAREAFAATSEMTRIIRSVIESDYMRQVLNDHDGSEFGRWRALAKRYPSALELQVENRLASAGHFLAQRLNLGAYKAWPSRVVRSVERAAQKAVPFSAQ